VYDVFAVGTSLLSRLVSDFVQVDSARPSIRVRGFYGWKCGF